MSAHTTGDTSRKPSGSSTRSAGHSPSASPSNAHSQRKLTPTTASNMFGMGMGSATSLKGLNSGWQVWGTATPPSKRNASISSAASVNDLSPSQGDSTYRGTLGESWSAPRSSSATWDEMSGSPQKNDLSQVESPLSLHHARQRQANVGHAPALAAPRIDDRASAAAGQFSPQRFDNNISKDSSVPNRYSTTTSPTKPVVYGSAAFANQNGNYDSLQASSIAENELSMSLRGMAVEDDYVNGQASQYRQQVMGAQYNGVQSVSPTIPQVRAPYPMQQGRSPYGTYAQPEYPTYYTNGTGRDPYMEYSYGYGNAADPSVYGSTTGITNGSSPGNLYSMSAQTLHPNAVAGQQTGMFYDYSTSGRPPASQFYYPAPQAMLYPTLSSHSPIPTPQLSAAIPATLSDKKRDLQYNIQQQMTPQNLIYPGMRSTPSPHSQTYGGALDYSAQLPMLLSGGGMYAPGMNGQQPLHMYQQNMAGRRNDVHEPAMALRSPLLEEFRANKARKWDLRDIFGYVVEFSGDQHGSRFIQQKLETATSEEKQLMFDEIVPNNTLQLIQDVFGNYVIQKLFEHGTQVQKTVLANTMEGHVLPLSLQMYGCRVVQKAVEYVLPEQQGAFVKELEPHVLKCVKDANGNHVIQKLIERVSPERLAFINSFRGNVYDLSTHPYGCRVLQRCFEHLPEDQTRPLLDELHRYMINLMQDQFGNYVVQFVLEHGKATDRAQVILKLRGQILQMARHKFASNVCEKALMTADADSRRILIEEIMTPKADGVSPIVTMMKDQFANYVLQRALGVVEGEQRERLMNLVRPQLVSMRRYSSAYSKHLISIERLLEKYSKSSDSVQDYAAI